MTSTAPRIAPATEADFFAIPEEQRFHELLGGEIVEKALPSGRHGAAQLLLGSEILSRSNAARDLWDKLRLYHRASVPHYWVLDPDHHTLRVHRFAEPGYQVVLDVGREAVVRAEPFELLELVVAELVDDDG